MIKPIDIYQQIQNSNQMSLGKKLVLSKEESQQTCESMPRSVPRKIEQETIKLNYQGLVTIPRIKLPHNIRRLYLSHNKIATLQGIEAFTALQSINLSYNCLHRVQELRRIPRPELLKHLKIRMNPLPYGYQDYAVAIFPHLQSFEDLKLNKQNKEVHFILRQFVSRNILEFLRVMEIAIDQQNNCEAEKENNMNSFNGGTEASDKAKRREIIIKGLVAKLQKLYLFPTHQTLANMSVTNLLTVSAEIIRVVCESSISSIPPVQHHLQTNKRLFQNLFESILLKMSARHDKTLAQYIQSLQNTDLNLQKIQAFRKVGIFHQDQEPKVEARIVAGCTRSPSLTQNPAKYLNKISAESLKEHPMNRLVRWRDPQKKSLLQMEETKWHNFYQQRISDEMEVVDEQIPLFIYCKQYLEVIAEIIFDQLSLLLQQQHQASKKTSKAFLVSNFVNQEVQEEIELQLSMSDGISFGAHEGNEFKDASAGCSQAIGIQDKESFYQQKTRPVFKQSYNDNYYNIESYSLHQINLAYKVFRGLKARVKRRKNRLHHYN